MMDATERDDLRRLAGSATAGKWRRASGTPNYRIYGDFRQVATAYQVKHHSKAGDLLVEADGQANAAFIAAANPAVVLDLLDRLEAAEKDAAGAKASFLTLRVTANEMQVRAQRAERLLDEAGKALEPFGKLVDDYLADTANFDDDAIMAGRMTHRGEEGTPPRVTFGDFRRARAVQASIRAATEPTEM